MDITLLLVLFLYAQSMPLMGVSRQYYLVNLHKTWKEAESFCNERGQHLATIDTLEEQARVAQELEKSGIGWAWIGLYDDVKSWKWSMGDTVLYEDGNTNIGDWFHLTQTNSWSNEYCARMNHDGTLEDFSCDRLFYSVCYDEPSNTYIPVTVDMTWSSAQSYCRERYTDLTSMRSLHEKQNITSVINNQSAWWVGLYRDKWKWSDQTDSSFRAWRSGEPNNGHEQCALTGLDGWNDIHCGWRNRFFCSALTLTTLKMVFKTQGSLNLNDPMIQEVLLMHMEQHIRDHGVQQQLQFSWNKQPNGLVFNNSQAQL